MNLLPQLETDDLALRPFTPGDARKVFAMSQEEGIRKWMPSQVYRDEAHAASVLATLAAQYRADIDLMTAPFVLGIELKSSGALVGHAGISPLQGGLEVGFAVERSQQGKGIATLAVRTLCEWAAMTCPGTRILGIAAQENNASQRVLMRSGFQRQAATEMLFQGREQPVVVFAYSAKIPPAI